MKVGPFAREDLPAILAIQSKNPQAAQWSEADYERLAENHGGLILTAQLETLTSPKVLGFAAFHRVIDQAELRNLAVDPQHQRQGIGRALLEDARKRLLESGAKRLFLEVRASNMPALGLYYSLGFGMHSRRKGYYRDPEEDGMVLLLELSPPASGPVGP